jgi:hypothetical protein
MPPIAQQPESPARRAAAIAIAGLDCLVSRCDQLQAEILRQMYGPDRPLPLDEAAATANATLTALEVLGEVAIREQAKTIRRELSLRN